MIYPLYSLNSVDFQIYSIDWMVYSEDLLLFSIDWWMLLLKIHLSEVPLEDDLNDK